MTPKERNSSIFDQYPTLRNFDDWVLPEAFQRSSILDQLGLQMASGIDQPIVVVADIDHTLQVKGLERVAHQLGAVLNQFHIPLIAITGLDKSIVHERIATGILPPPQVIVGTGGLDIDVLQTDSEFPIYRQDLVYRLLVEVNPNWNKEDLLVQVRKLIDTYPDFKIHHQTESRNNIAPVAVDPYKIGLYFFADSTEKRRELSKILNSTFPGVLSLICSEINHNQAVGRQEKYCLDLAVMDKLGAVLYLQKVLGIQHGLVAGDSGNDFRFVALSPGLFGVLVGGFKEELKDYVDELIMQDSSANQRKKGFQKLRVNENDKRLYIEHTERIGPQTIRHVLRACARARSASATSPQEKAYFTELSEALRFV